MIPSTGFAKLGILPWDKGDGREYEGSRDSRCCMRSWVDALRALGDMLPGEIDEMIRDRAAMNAMLRENNAEIVNAFRKGYSVPEDNLPYLMRWLEAQKWRTPVMPDWARRTFDYNGAFGVSVFDVLLWLDTAPLALAIPTAAFNAKVARAFRVFASDAMRGARTRADGYAPGAVGPRGGLLQDLAAGLNTLQFMAWVRGQDEVKVAEAFGAKPEHFWGRFDLGPRDGVQWSLASHVKQATHAQVMSEDRVLLGVVAQWLMNSVRLGGSGESREDGLLREAISRTMVPRSRADLWVAASGIDPEMATRETNQLIRMLGPPFADVSAMSPWKVASPRIKR